MEIDSSQREDRTVKEITPRLSIVFFCPSYRPSETGRGDRVWAHLQLLAGISDISLSAKAEKWIEPLAHAPRRYTYSAMGEIVRDCQTKARYLDVGFLVSLDIGGRDKLLGKLGKTKRFSEETTFIRVDRGNLFGDLELWDPELRPDRR